MRRTIGIYTRADKTRGLWRDAEALMWALGGHPVTLPREPTLAGSIFAVQQYGDMKAVDGASYLAWLDTVEAVIVVENLTNTQEVLRTAKARGKRVIFVPNLDWAAIGEDTKKFVSTLNRLRTTTGARVVDQVWAKTPKALARLVLAGVRPDVLRCVSWSIPDPVVTGRHPVLDSGRVRFYMNAGYHGWRERRGVDIALAAFAKLRKKQGERVTLRIHSLKTAAQPATPGVVWIQGPRSRDDLRADLLLADVVLAPARWEGLGLTLLEALHAGVPVLATDGWPMNELFAHGVHGRYVHAKNVGRMRLADRFEVDDEALFQQMDELVENPSARGDMTCAEPGLFIARQHAFGFRVRAFAAGQEAPSVVLVRSPGKGQDEERSEQYWEAALDDFGLAVEVVAHDNPQHVIDVVQEVRPAFVLCGKTPAPLVAEIKRRCGGTVAVYHHDLMAAASSWLRWFQKVMKHADFGFLPEDPLNYADQPFFKKLVRLLPGPRVAPPGSRLGRRFPLRMVLERLPGVLHQTTYRSEERVRVLAAIAQRGVPLLVQGPGPRAAFGPGVTCADARWGWDGRMEAARADVLLSASMMNHVAGYTSNRLMNAGAVGACVLAIRYPGCDKDYTRDAVYWTRMRSVGVSAETLVADTEQQAVLRSEVLRQTWQKHSWHRRFETMLRVIGTSDVGAAGSDYEVSLHLAETKEGKS